MNPKMPKPLLAVLATLLCLALACNLPQTAFPSPAPAKSATVQPATATVRPPTAEPTTTGPATIQSASQTGISWASRSFSEPEDLLADPDMANGEPDVTDCDTPMLATWAPPASDQPQSLTLTYGSPLILSQVRLFLVGNPQEILRIEALNSRSGLGKLIYDGEQEKGRLSAGEPCPVQVSIPVSTDFEVDTIIINTAASQNPLQVDAVGLVGFLDGYVDVPVYWRVPLPGQPIGLAMGPDGIIYVATDPDGLFNQAVPARDELYAYDVEGNQLRKIAIPSGSNLSAIATDPFGNLVLTDSAAGRFSVLSSEGQLLTSGGEQLSSGDVAVSPYDGNLYLLAGNLIQVYTTDTGDFVREITLDETHSYRGLTFDPLGAFYVLRDFDWEPAWVRFSSAGQEQNARPLATSSVVDNVARDMASDERGNFYVLFSLNTASIAIHQYDPDGYFLRRFGKLDYDSQPTPEGAFFEPTAITVSPDGRFIIVADGREGAYFLTAFLLEPEP